MTSNIFGEYFKMLTWGESHGPAIGVVLDGVPAGLPLNEQDIAQELVKRAPGTQNDFVSPRNEPDRPHIYSGVFQGQTTGAPISIVIYNKDADSSKYEATKNILRPGHANFTYLEKYGVFDYRGGGRASARETAARVAAGAVAKKLLQAHDIQVLAYLAQVGPMSGGQELHQQESLIELAKARNANMVHCICPVAQQEIVTAINRAKAAGDSLGGVVGFQTSVLPTGLGAPVYQKLEAKLAMAMLSIPATKGFEFGRGFASATMQGSAHNDLFTISDAKPGLSSNQAGGTLGGITTGAPVYGRVAFKPTSSIKKSQASVTLDGKKAAYQQPAGSRHDPCVALRGVFVVEAMLALCLADCLLEKRLNKLCMA